MSISPDRQSHLAHLIVDGIWKDDLVDFSDDDKAMRAGKQAMAKFSKELSEIDEFAKDRVASLKRGVVEGSPEWDVLYQKYFEEELQRRGN